MTTTLVELLHNLDDCDYCATGHIAAHEVRSNNWIPETPDAEEQVGGRDRRRHALITMLSTATHAAQNYLTFTSLAVLPRVHTVDWHPEIFGGTLIGSVFIVLARTSEAMDVALPSAGVGVEGRRFNAVSNTPVVKMSFAPNGRFEYL